MLIAISRMISLIILAYLFYIRLQKNNVAPKYITFSLIFSNFSRVLFPIKTIVNPLVQLPNWIPAPIPQYTPAPFHLSIRINNLAPIPEDCFNQSNPEIPTLINSLNNAVVFPNGSFVTSDYYIPSLTNYFDNTIPSSFMVDFHFYKVIDQAIPFFHWFLKTYYHFIIEILPLVVCLGKQIIQNSVILHTKLMKEQFKEICSVLDLNFKGNIYMKKPLFVKKLFFANSNIFIEFNANAVRHFRHQMIEKCNATNIKATQNVYYNRPKNRFILNFNELKIQLKKELPQVEFVEPPTVSIAEQVVFWRKTKFAMMVHGSIFSNFIFMHPNTAYLEFSLKVCRNAAQKLCQSFGIYIYQMMFTRHCLNRSMYADIPELIPVVKQILKMLETQDLSLY